MKIKLLLLMMILTLSGCAVESSRKIETTQATSYSKEYQGIKSSIAVGKFENRSSYQNGIFSDGIDRLGNQSKTILISQLQQTQRFTVLDRTNMAETKSESTIKKQSQNLKGASFIITGDVSEFGRKEVGDHQLWGIIGRGKTQVAYAKVTLNIINVKTSEVVFSTQGAGEYQLSNREIIGFGGTASYDSTLNGKVINLAISEAVDNLIQGIENGVWRPTE